MANKDLIVKNGLQVNSSFSVNSTAIYWSNTFSINSTSYSGTSNNSTYSNGSYTNTFTIGTSTYFVSNGNVGVGTNTPGYPLHIKSTISSDVRTEANTYAKFSFNVSGAGTDAKRWQQYAFSGGLTFSALNDAENAETAWLNIARGSGTTITTVAFPSGNVGIGTNSPSYKLDVSGDIISSNYFLPATAGTFGTVENGMAVYNSTGSGGITNSLIFKSNNIERMRIASNGNVGIGTSSPAHKLAVSSGSSQFPVGINILESSHTTSRRAALLLGDWYLLQDTNGNGNKDFGLYDASIPAWRVYISNTGNVGIGTTTPTHKLQVDGIIYSKSTSDVLRRFGLHNNQREWSISVYDSSSYPGIFVIADESAGAVRAAIDLSGSFLIGYPTNTSATSGRLFSYAFGGEAAASLHNAAQNSFGLAVQIQYTNSYFCWFNFGTSTVGSIGTDGSSTSYNTTSDYRIKTNVGPIENAIERVKSLHPVGFNYIANPNKRFDGFIAHEVQEVAPAAVTGEKDAVNDDGTNKLQQMDASKLIPLLTAALQKALEKIDELEDRIVELEK